MESKICNEKLGSAVIKMIKKHPKLRLRKPNHRKHHPGQSRNPLDQIQRWPNVLIETLAFGHDQTNRRTNDERKEQT